MTRRVTVLGALVPALLVLGLAACTGDESVVEELPSPTPSVTVEVTGAPAVEPSMDVPEKPETVVDITDQPGSGDYVGASADAALTRCEVADGRLEVAGTVAHDEDQTQDYRIYVSAMRGSDTRGLVQVEAVGVASGEAREWVTSIALTDDDLTCSLRVERRVA